MSITKYNSELDAPTAASVGISPAGGQNTMIAIAFTDVEIYGKNGATWELVGTTSSDDKVVFVSFETYSQAYFKSNTGSAEVVRVFWIDEAVAAAPAAQPTSVSEIGDMPAFTPADEGKVLSIDSSGNLVWIARQGGVKMRKQKFIRQQAHVGAPALVSSFEAPATHSAEISVVFGGKDVAIHGWNGSAWTQIYRWDGQDLQLTFQNTYQKYYLQSFTGGAEAMGVSFFSVDKVANSTLRNVSESSTFHDLAGVPVYNSGDEGKFLTVMSDGSLKWLAGDEPTEVEKVSTSGGARVIDGIIKSGFGFMSGKWSDYVTFSGDSTVETDFTISFWWKYNETPVAAILADFGLFGSEGGYQFWISDHPISGVKSKTHFGAVHFAGGDAQVSKDPNTDHPWVHYTIVRTSTNTKFYVDGVFKHDHGANTDFIPQDANSEFALGAIDSDGSLSKYDTLFEGFAITEGSALDAAGVQSLFDAGRPSENAGGGGGGAPAPLTAHNGATIDGSGLIQTNAGYVSGLWSDFVAFTGNTPDNSDLTVSFWWKHDETPAPGNTPEFGLWSSYEAANNGYLFYISDHWSSGLKLKTHWGVSYFPNREDMISEVAGVDHPWNHFVFVRTNANVKLYWNGTYVSQFPSTIPFVPNNASADFTIGATTDAGGLSSKSTLFDKFQVLDGQALDAAGVQALYNQGR